MCYVKKNKLKPAEFALFSSPFPPAWLEFGLGHSLISEARTLSSSFDFQRSEWIKKRRRGKETFRHHQKIMDKNRKKRKKKMLLLHFFFSSKHFQAPPLSLLMGAVVFLHSLENVFLKNSKLFYFFCKLRFFTFKNLRCAFSRKEFFFATRGNDFPLKVCIF